MDLTTLRGPRKRVLLEYFDDKGEKQSILFRDPWAEESVDVSTQPSITADNSVDASMEPLITADNPVGANTKPRKKTIPSSSGTKKIISKANLAKKTSSKKTKGVLGQMPPHASASTVPLGLKTSTSSGTKSSVKTASGTSVPRTKVSSLKGSPNFASLSALSKKKELSDANNNQISPMSPSPTGEKSSAFSSESHAAVKQSASATTMVSASSPSTSAAITTPTIIDIEASDRASAILDELERFVTEFKNTRIKRGFTQTDVSKIIATINPNLSQTTISRFETLSLSYPNITRLRYYGLE